MACLKRASPLSCARTPFGQISGEIYTWGSAYVKKHPFWPSHIPASALGRHRLRTPLNGCGRWTSRPMRTNSPQGRVPLVTCCLVPYSGAPPPHISGRLVAYVMGELAQASLRQCPGAAAAVISSRGFFYGPWWCFGFPQTADSPVGCSLKAVCSGKTAKSFSARDLLAWLGSPGGHTPS